MLAASKFYILPVLNVDGAALVESHYKWHGTIINKRKNMNPSMLTACGDEEGGTDLNRNWPMDWKAQDSNDKENGICGEYWPGDKPLSEPEN